MAAFEPVWVLGLMSGTSMDGVDGAAVLTDGQKVFELGESFFRPYSQAETAAIAAAQGLWADEKPALLQRAAAVVETAHAEVIDRFGAIDLVGFHGQTLAHDPAQGRTHQLGDGAALARRVQKTVIWDFRSADVLAGGQGAPLAPFYHFACVRSIGATGPSAWLNLGGVGNVTLVDPSKLHPEEPGALLAFDTGPANAPINDLMSARLGQGFDKDGALATQGVVDEALIDSVLEMEYFNVKPPKSLDRNDFSDVLARVSCLSDADAAATLSALVAACVAAGRRWFAAPASCWLVSGGGARNPVIMAQLAARLEAEVVPIDALGFDGDMLEAQAFAFLAVRVLRGLPTSAPGTTGVAQPVCGGRISRV